jgi:hypothetical protein
MIDTILHNLPFKLGFSPKSWQLITDVAILKSKGEYRVEKMRTIMLFDVCCNMNNKRLSKLLGLQSEKYNLLPMEQYAKSHHRCDDLAMNKHLVLDISRMK